MSKPGLPKQKMMRADLHNYGAIAFHDPQLSAQGYEPGRILLDFVDACFRNNIQLSAVTSCKEEIAKGSVHDRFGTLVQQRDLLPKDYEFAALGDNAMRVAHGNNEVYLVNAQMIIADDGGIRTHHLAVGTNSIPNKLGLEETIARCADAGALQFAVNPFCHAKYGIGMREFERYHESFDGVLGHMGEIMFPDFMSLLPVAGGQFKRLSRSLNARAKEAADEFGVPSISVSGAHWYEEVGRGAIEFVKDHLAHKSEAGIISSLGGIIKSRNYASINGYCSLLNAAKSMLIFNKSARENWP